jgi:outer membrane protein OmpA-like peptidoglycan-associated protein
MEGEGRTRCVPQVRASIAASFWLAFVPACGRPPSVQEPSVSAETSADAVPWGSALDFSNLGVNPSMFADADSAKDVDASTDGSLSSDAARAPTHPFVVWEGPLFVPLTVTFDRDSARLLPPSARVLEEVHALLGAHPEIELAEVDGFVDTRKDTHSTVELSLRRAQAVVRELVRLGTSPSRLRAQALGPYCTSIDAGGASYETNARVSFRIVRSGGHVVPPGWGGCGEAEAHDIKPPP